jgi:hypothetical protein
METVATFETKVTLSPRDLGDEIPADGGIDKILEDKIRTQYEGRCSRSGYIVPGSINLLSRSYGMVEKGRYSGDILFVGEVECKVLYPPDGTIIDAKVMRKNKMGLYAEYANGAIRVMVPRDLHLGNEEYHKVEEGDFIEIEIKKSRYQVNDTSILSVGKFRAKKQLSDLQTAQPTRVISTAALREKAKSKVGRKEKSTAASTTQKKPTTTTVPSTIQENAAEENNSEGNNSEENESDEEEVVVRGKKQLQPQSIEA